MHNTHFSRVRNVPLVYSYFSDKQQRKEDLLINWIAYSLKNENVSVAVCNERQVFSIVPEFPEKYVGVTIDSLEQLNLEPFKCIRGYEMIAPM